MPQLKAATEQDLLPCSPARRAIDKATARSRPNTYKMLEGCVRKGGRSRLASCSPSPIVLVRIGSYIELQPTQVLGNDERATGWRYYSTPCLPHGGLLRVGEGTNTMCVSPVLCAVPADTHLPPYDDHFWLPPTPTEYGAIVAYDTKSRTVRAYSNMGPTHNIVG